MLLKALLTVVAKVVPVRFSNTSPITFLTPFLNKLHPPDSDVRLLIDRKANVEKLGTAYSAAEIGSYCPET